MNVGTGEFRALTGRVDGLERQVADLAAEVAVQSEVTRLIMSMLVVERDCSAPAQPRRPRHLHAVDGGQS
jgi:hypothetical protein